MLDAVTALLRRRWVLFPMACALVVALATMVWLGDRVADDGHELDRVRPIAARQEAGEQALDVARAVAVRLTTYSYRSLAQDFSWVEAVGTASFQRDFAATRKQAEQIISSTRATASGQVIDAAPRVKDADHVTALLFVDQTLRTRSNPHGSVDQSRVSIDLVRVDAQWRVDAVQLDSVS